MEGSKGTGHTQTPEYMSHFLRTSWKMPGFGVFDAVEESVVSFHCLHMAIISEGEQD